MMSMTWLPGDVCYLFAATFLIKNLCMSFETYRRRDVYFFNICNIRVFYCFIRSRAVTTYNQIRTKKRLIQWNTNTNTLPNLPKPKLKQVLYIPKKLLLKGENTVAANQPNQNKTQLTQNIPTL